MKKYFEIIKILWKNPRTHALIVLFLYIFFFAFIFAIVDFDSNKNIPNNLSINDKFYNLDNYSYNMTINKNNEKIELKGIKSTNENITINNVLYNVIDGVIYDNDNKIYNLYDLNFKSLYPSNLQIFETEGILNATTNYKDEKVLELYELDCSKLDISYNDICSFSILKTKKMVEKIELNININNDKYNIIIEYTL